MGELLTVYASIGNSDDKLTQQQWAEFHQLFTMLVRRAAEHVHGDWLSATNSPWQNACMCFEIEPDAAQRLKTVLGEAAGEFGQESIAWAVADTEFIAPPADRPRREPRAAQYTVGGLGPAPTPFDTEARTIAETQAARDGS